MAAHAVDELLRSVVDALAVKGNPRRQAVGLTLISRGVGRVSVERLVIAPQQRHGAAKRLEIVAPAAAGARVDQHARMTPQQVRPNRPR